MLGACPSVHPDLAAIMGLFCSVAKQAQNGSTEVFPYSPRHIGLGSCKKFGRTCMISCMNAYRLNQTGKSSFREVYHDHEKHDYDHENGSQAFHTTRVHVIHHPRHSTTSFQTINPTFNVNMGAEY
jgi:hypothetical protein